MAMQRAEKFLRDATVTLLKQKLDELSIDSVGLKSVVKIRLQEAIKNLSEAELEQLFPADVIEPATSEDIQDSGEDPYVDDGDLDAEIVRLQQNLQKKQKIAELRRQIAELTCEEIIGSSSKPVFHFRDVEDSFVHFTGDDNYCIKRWLQNFEESSEAMGWDAKLKFIYCKRLMGGTAKLFLRTVGVHSWLELKAALLKEFARNVTSADIHNQLRNRRKKKDETVQQYVIHMQEIAYLGNVDEGDLIFYIINGIPDSSPNKVLLYGANSLVELKALLLKYEKMKRHLPVVEHPVKEDKQLRVVSKTSFGLKCYNCGESGHVINKCTKPKRQRGSCYRCGEIGHIVAKCPKQPVMVTDSLVEEPAGSSRNSEYQLLRFSNNFQYNLRYVFQIEPSSDVMTTTTALTLIDTGSPISFAQERYVPAYATVPLDMEDGPKYCGINNSRLDLIGRVSGKVYCFENCVDISLLVVKNDSMRYPFVLGRDFLSVSNAILTTSREMSDVDKDVNPVKELDSAQVDDEHLNDIFNIDIVEKENVGIDLNINENLSYDTRKRIKEIINLNYTDNIPNYDRNEMKDEFEMNITLVKDSNAFSVMPRRLAYSQKVELQKIIDDLLKRKIITESNSPFSSPVVLVKKKTGDFRLCVDFRHLNKITQKDNYPLPLIEDNLDRLRGKRYFTLLDLKDGFHHVRVSEDSRKYTSFVTPMGQYEYLRMPFGLKNAPAVFQRYVNSLFRNLINDDKLLIYIDDLLIATETIEEHFDILEKVMLIVREKKLNLRYDKCKFLYDRITYLGYEVSAEGIGPNLEGLRAVKEFPVPLNVKDVQSFLGLCSYFRKFIKDFSIISEPLYNLLRKDVPYKMGSSEVKVFQNLKARLLCAPVLSIYDPRAETKLHCDASALGFGAVLMQRQQDKRFHPVLFFSKRATPQEAKYHSYELETLAIIYALRRFRVYLLGIKFKIITDCRSLTLTLGKKLLNPRISRWGLELQEFDYCIEHRDGKRMGHVDALSRCHNVLVIESESFEHALAAAQHKDPTIKNIAEMLEKKESPRYELINGLVYRKYKGKIYFYVPSQMEWNVIQTHHDSLCHAGVERCYEFLKKIYWFPELKKKIKDYIKSCLRCILFSAPGGKKEGELHNIPKGNKPFEVIHVDHYGPLPPSVRGARYIFAIVDGFTKFTKLYPVKTTSTKDVISCLNLYFVAYSRPHKIISDRGSCFTSDDFSKFCIDYDIKHVKIATGSPQSNGQVERINRSITPMLSKEAELDTSKWGEHLNQVEFAINNTTNRSIGTTPSMLLFGVRQKGTVKDKIFEYLEANKLDEQRDVPLLRDKATECIARIQEANVNYHRKKHKIPHKYQVGDLVVIKNIVSVPGINKKLVEKYKGPYEVVKNLPNDRYIIKDIPNLQISRVPYEGVACPENMKPYARF